MRASPLLFTASCMLRTSRLTSWEAVDGAGSAATKARTGRNASRRVRTKETRFLGRCGRILSLSASVWQDLSLNSGETTRRDWRDVLLRQTLLEFVGKQRACVRPPRERR